MPACFTYIRLAASPTGDVDSMPKKTASGDNLKKPAITEKQLRALSRRHLLMMIRDLERELAQAKAEKDEMLLAFRAGVELPAGFVVTFD